MCRFIPVGWQWRGLVVVREIGSVVLPDTLNAMYHGSLQNRCHTPDYCSSWLISSDGTVAAARPLGFIMARE
jgi:hypothetical protein